MKLPPLPPRAGLMLGIPFDASGMILTIYARLDEFLKRRRRLQKVEEEVTRRIVLKFFETLHWSRQFQKHMERKRAGRMAGVPQLGIPDIYVDDNETEGGSGEGGSNAGGSRRRFPLASLRAEDAGSSNRSHNSWGSAAGRSTAHQSYQHPLGAPRTSTSPTRHQSASTYSFELQSQSGGDAGTRSSLGDLRRQTSGAGPSRVQDMMDDSVWVDSLRRSATTKKSRNSSERFGNDWS